MDKSDEQLLNDAPELAKHIAATNLDNEQSLRTLICEFEPYLLQPSDVQRKLCLAESALALGLGTLAKQFVAGLAPTEDNEVRKRLANVYYHLGDHDAARAIYAQQALAALSADELAQYGFCLLAAKNYQYALDMFNNALRIEPKHPLAIHGFCAASFIFSPLEEVGHILEQALKHDVASLALLTLTQQLAFFSGKERVEDFIVTENADLSALELDTKHYNKNLYASMQGLMANDVDRQLAEFNLLLIDDPSIRILSYIAQASVQRFLQHCQKHPRLLAQASLPKHFKYRAVLISYDKQRSSTPAVDADSWLTQYYFIRNPNDDLNQALRYPCLHLGEGPSYLHHRLGSYPCVDVIPTDGQLVFFPAYIWHRFKHSFEFKQGFAIKISVLAA